MYLCAFVDRSISLFSLSLSLSHIFLSGPAYRFLLNNENYLFTRVVFQFLLFFFSLFFSFFFLVHARVSGSYLAIGGKKRDLRSAFSL